MSKIVQIRNTRPRLYTANGVTLQPGLNKLSAEDAEKFLKHPHIKIKQDRGFIEIVKAEKTKPKEPVVEQHPELKGLNVEKSVEVIAEATDEALLKAALADDRKGVREAAEARVAALIAAQGE